MNAFEHVEGEWEIPADIVKNLEAIEHRRREAVVRSSGMAGGYKTAGRRPFMGPGPLDPAYTVHLDTYVKGARAVRPVTFHTARTAWTWIRRYVRDNPYAPIRVPPEFRQAVLNIKTMRQGREAAALLPLPM